MAEVRMNSLPSGYEYEFISTVLDDHHCLICHLPLREPVQTRCGHRFCKKCLNEAIRRLPVPACPADRERLDPEKDIFPDKATERNILSCHVKCPSKECEWTGEARYVETHLESCGYKIITCPNSNCHMQMERRLVDDHVTNLCQWRIVHCGYCNEKHVKCDEEVGGEEGLDKLQASKPCESLKASKHANECQKIPIDCSNGCGQVIAREEIGNHIETDCSLTMIPCPYFSVGCNTKVEREKLASHLQCSTEAHLALACVKLNDAQEQLVITRVELNKAQIQLLDTQIKLDKTQGQLENTQTQLTDTQETTRDLVKKVDELQRQLKEGLNEKQVNEAIERKVIQMKKAKSFMWKIQNFSEVLRKAKEIGGFHRILKSEPFYTESCGYKMQLLLYPNGDGSGLNTHISVFHSVIEGEYDALLSWPLSTAVKITLIDQPRDIFPQNPVDFYFTHKVNERPKENSNCSLGSPAFVSHEKLKTRRYLIDDTLFLRVVIGPDTTQLKWWSTDPIERELSLGLL